MQLTIRNRLKTWPKWSLALASAAVVVLISGSITLATISIISPTSLNYQTVPTHNTLQTFTASDCAAMDTYTTVTLTDNRDSQNYQVRKMPDAHCWMIDNLKLAGGVTLTTADTNLDENTPSDFTEKFAEITSPVQNSTTHGSGRCTSHSSVAIANGSGYLTCNGASTYDDTNDGFVAYSDPASSVGNYENCTPSTYYGTSVDSLTGCGYLYNWYTATAGTGNYQKTSGSATASICPVGWHLPNATTTRDFYVLDKAMVFGATSDAGVVVSTQDSYPNWIYNGPWQGSASGRYSATTISGQGHYGYYWSADASSKNQAQFFGLQGYQYIYTQGYSSNKYEGLAARCVL
jgi:uncharacterized protein (TIGR02145 family)